MSFQAPISVADAISRITERRLLLPAIQREFIWGPEKVEWLFDPLLQGYPLGSFLFWEVRGTSRSQYQYYEFLRVFRERFGSRNPEFNTQGHYDFDAVLDGQQRLTAIYIGLKGTYAYKLPRRWWEDTENRATTSFRSKRGGPVAAPGIIAAGTGPTIGTPRGAWLLDERTGSSREPACLSERGGHSDHRGRLPADEDSAGESIWGRCCLVLRFVLFSGPGTSPTAFADLNRKAQVSPQLLL